MSDQPIWMLDTAKLIQAATEKVEAYSENQVAGTRRHAELQLVWHHLIDAHNLLMKGRLTPDSLEWASAEAAKILELQ